MSTVLISGGTGLVGRALTKALLQKGYEVIILTRDARRHSIINASDERLSYASWNADKKYIDADAVSKADHIIHLAGAGVAEKRWTKKRKKEILDSRVNSSRLIVDSLQKIPNHVRSVISSSAIGWYGPDPFIPNPDPFKENAPASHDFLGSTCRQWEESVGSVAAIGKRLVIFRIGIVLSNDGGAIKEFVKPLRFGFATILGSGKQVLSWIHIDDLVNMFISAIENEKLEGVYNAVAPMPVSNKELILQLAKGRGRFFIPIRIPAFVLKLVLGELSIEVLKSATVSAEKIQQAGLRFSYETIAEALTAITKR